MWKKNCNYRIILAAIILFIYISLYSANDRPWGVWSSTHTIEKIDHPWIRGYLLAIHWEDIEPEPGVFIWTGEWDKKVNAALKNDCPIIINTWTGFHAPDWLYSHGVPKVLTDHTSLDKFPFYFNEKYKYYFKRMLNKIAEHIESYPVYKRKRFIAIQACTGSTGDRGPYKGKVINGKKYEIDEKGKEWIDFTKGIWKDYYDIFKNRNPKIHVIYNPWGWSDESPYIKKWLTTHCPVPWFKYAHQGHGYQLNFEYSKDTWFDEQKYINKNFNNEWIRVRSELSVRDFTSGRWKEAPVWNMYWLHLNLLHCGIDIQAHCQDSFKMKEYHTAFRFFNKYAGYRDPGKSPGAFCVLRDGLDSSDTKRFPEYKFGRADKKNIERMKKIVRAYSSRGAVQGDPAAAAGSTMHQRKAKAMNDVGWQILPGNFYKFLYQLDPDKTSQGYWRVGPKSQPYGRFAGGFDFAHSKNRICFDIDDEFVKSLSLRRTSPVMVRIIYFDRGRSTWALDYDSRSNSPARAMECTNNNSLRWKELNIRLLDAYFQNRCLHRSDLMLVNTDKEDDIFHLVEIYKMDSKELR